MTDAPPVGVRSAIRERYPRNARADRDTSPRGRERGIRGERFTQGLARTGLASRITIYGVVAVLCFDLAAGHPSAQTDAEGAFQEIHLQRGGTALLVVLACGLVAYSLWRFHQAAFGSARDGGSVWPRVGAAVIGLVYVLLFAEVAEILGTGTASGGSAAPVAATVLRWPAGVAILGVAAVVLGIAGVVFAVWGATRDLSRVLDRRRLRDGWWKAAWLTGALGDAARGAVACLLASALFSAAVNGKPSAAKGVGQLLAALRHSSVGEVAVIAIGIAFVAYAAFSAIELVAGRF